MLGAAPGPQYKLKSLVGYQEHCVSRLRNPAYTFGRRQISFKTCEGPGPIYVIVEKRHEGFTFGHAAKGQVVFVQLAQDSTMAQARNRLAIWTR
ncbi:hypothetical protein KM043_016632 [Ampulex compressa]|nr:hypothetical protein KM043_016632 [Ampulex compressa]